MFWNVLISLYVFFLRYNITTGLYPFEGENVYKLFENIGRGEFSIPSEIENPLRALLEGMLQKEPEKRLSLPQIRQHPWFTRKPPRTLEYVPVPPLRGDEFHTMTVLPYLMEYHYGDDSVTTENHTEYITEHEINEERRLQELDVPGQAVTGGSMSRRGGGSGTKRRWRRPISCISVKKFPSCKQS